MLRPKSQQEEELQKFNGEKKSQGNTISASGKFGRPPMGKTSNAGEFGKFGGS